MAPFETGPPADLMAPGMNSEFLSRPFISCRPFNILQEKRWFETHSHDSRKLSFLSLLCFLVHVFFTRLCASATHRKAVHNIHRYQFFTETDGWLSCHRLHISQPHLAATASDSLQKSIPYYCFWLVVFGCNPLFWRISMPKASFEILNDIIINLFLWLSIDTHHLSINVVEWKISKTAPLHPIKRPNASTWHFQSNNSWNWARGAPTIVINGVSYNML